MNLLLLGRDGFQLCFYHWLLAGPANVGLTGAPSVFELRFSSGGGVGGPQRCQVRGAAGPALAPPWPVLPVPEQGPHGAAAASQLTCSGTSWAFPPLTSRDAFFFLEGFWSLLSPFLK